MNEFEKEINNVSQKIKTAHESVKIFKDATEKYEKLQLQLIAISGGIFSIYLALKSTVPSDITKWGFIFLSVSLICGLLSVVFAIGSGFIDSILKLFNFEKEFFSKDIDDGIKKIIMPSDYTDPILYKRGNLKHNEAIRIGLDTMNKITNLTSVLGFFQIGFFLVSSVLLLVGFICLPKAG